MPSTNKNQTFPDRAVIRAYEERRQLLASPDTLANGGGIKRRKQLDAEIAFFKRFCREHDLVPKQYLDSSPGSLKRTVENRRQYEVIRQVRANQARGIVLSDPLPGRAAICILNDIRRLEALPEDGPTGRRAQQFSLRFDELVKYVKFCAVSGLDPLAHLRSSPGALKASARDIRNFDVIQSAIAASKRGYEKGAA
jgi:hypothetical protein